MLSLVRLLTFITGGLLSNLEKDFKKIVAFSTIRQISIIILFTSLSFTNIALAHILFHALFKTLLFVRAGVYFIKIYRKQLKNYISSKSNYKLLSTLLFLRIYGIRGLTFSSSFFSKDLIIEILCEKERTFILIFLIVGSLLTLLYSVKLIDASKSNVNTYKTFIIKNFKFNFILVFIVRTNYVGLCSKFLFSIDTTPMISGAEILIILFIFASPLILITKRNRNLFIVNYAQSVSYIKIFTFRLSSKMLNLEIHKNISFNDFFFFKKRNLSDQND